MLDRSSREIQIESFGKISVGDLNNAVTPTEKRDLVTRLVHNEPDRALVIARSIEDPWFACQALACVARFCPENKFGHIIEESLKVGRSADDPFRIVASAAWPVRAIVEREHPDMLDSIIPELLNQAEHIELLASRSEALFLLFQAVFPAGREKWFGILQALMRASENLINWRQRRNLRDAILIVWNDDAELAKEIISHLEDSKLKRQIESGIMKSEQHLPRPFFWRSAT